ncbi:MAG: RIP metalloprotease RseP [Yoonia sp.]|nr:RIP metalloprotease RseP [Yoonia sp.]
MDFSQVLPSLGGTAFTLIAFVVALSIIVAIHEYGHYIVGRWCGIHAEVFSLGFGPVLASRTDKHGTKWQLAALPFGGYVRFLGDANAAGVGDTGEVPQADQRRSMHGAPLWARALTVLAGPVFNFILAVFIFAGGSMLNGSLTDPLTFEEGRDLPAPFISELQAGDQLITVQGVAFGGETSIIDQLPVQATLNYGIVRGGRSMTVKGPYLMPPAASGITPRSAADDAGLRKDDVIVAVDDTPVVAFDELIAAVKAADGSPLDLDVWRAGEFVEVTLSPRRVDLPLPEGGFETRWLIGVSGEPFFTAATDRLGPWESLTNGVSMLNRILTSSLSGMWHIASGKISSCNLSGPVAIAQTSGSMASQGATDFIWFLGMLSAAVGMINLFPIPVLDGGHLVFHAYEAVFRRKPSEKAFNALVLIGVALIGTMMVFALLNDLVLCP